MFQNLGFIFRFLLFQELFVRLVPYHCLGSLWSQRDKKGREGVCWSVRATIRQFNKLANAVLASCLYPTKLRCQQRARLLEKWISVAEVNITMWKEIFSNSWVWYIIHMSSWVSRLPKNPNWAFFFLTKYNASLQFQLWTFHNLEDLEDYSFNCFYCAQ